MPRGGRNTSRRLVVGRLRDRGTPETACLTDRAYASRWNQLVRPRRRLDGAMASVTDSTPSRYSGAETLKDVLGVRIRSEIGSGLTGFHTDS
jgi:hypothetical protein